MIRREKCAHRWALAYCDEGAPGSGGVVFICNWLRWLRTVALIVLTLLAVAGPAGAQQGDPLVDVKRSVQRFLNNLGSPGVTINDVLQCEFYDAGITVWRFVINTTFGIGGLFDPAQYLGVHGHSADFDQTLALYGVPSGPFLMLPVFGPTTVRGGFGTIVDTAFRPTTYFLAGTDQFVFAIIHGGSSGLATREASFDAIEDLERSSLDYYAALRNAYYQKRMGDIWRRRQQPLLKCDARHPRLAGR
jgi:ABC-type transporter lipoprotein component MlaA